jgi:cysteine desulfurase
MDRRTPRGRIAVSERVYLDHAATTATSPAAIAAMLAVLAEAPYNASSIHAEGRAARARLDDARDRTARILGAKGREIVFTSGGSESVNLALIGAAKASAQRGRHVVIGATEHAAARRACDALEAEGWATTHIPVDADGQITPDAFAAALRPDTTVASVMLANNEIGTIAPIAALAAIAQRANVVFHTDAVQAPAWLALDVRALGVDLLSISGHKFGGPKGVGALFVRAGTPIAAQIVGGGQENGARAGTENVAGIVGLTVALEIAQAQCASVSTRVAALRDRLESAVLARIPGSRIIARGAQRIAGVSSIAFADLTASALLIRLDLEGIAAAAGSACAAGSLEPSHVIAALGLPAAFVGGVLRFSLGSTTTAAEIDRLVAILPGLVAHARGAALVV